MKSPSPQTPLPRERDFKGSFFRCSSLALWEREVGRVRVVELTLK